MSTPPPDTPAPNTPLLRGRRFLPLFLTQALGALNHNLFKNALVVLVLFRASEGGAPLVALSGGLFILPYALFSALAGQLADRHDKSRLIRATKALEVALMALAAAGFLLGSVPLLMAVLFGLGTQGAFFGPLKYGILPDHLAERELVQGNALVEAATFGGILLGTIAGGILVGLPGGPALVSAAGLLIALGGLTAALFIPPTAAAAPGLRPGWNIWRETADLVRAARGNREVWLAVLGLSWFWTMGATLIAEFPVLAKQDFGADNRLVTLLLTCFAVGVGMGSLLASRLLRGEISARHVPPAAALLSVFVWAFAALASGGAASGWHTPGAMLASPPGVLALLCLVGAAVCGGVYSVPLFALLQERSEPSRRARTVAANNVVNAAAMAAGAGVVAGLTALGVSAPTILSLAALLNLGVAVLVCGLLPQDSWRALFRLYFRLFHRVQVSGLEHLEAAGESAVVVANHTSFLDGCLLGAYLPGRPVFAVDTHIARRWWARPFLAPVDVLTVDPANPYAARGMVHLVRAGHRLVVFPEGRITRTGGLMKVYDGAALVADRAGAPVVPVRIDGLHFTPFSRMGGKLRRRPFARVRLTVSPPVRLDADPALQGRARRRALGTAMQDLMARVEFETRPLDRSLFAALLDAARTHGAGRPIAEDIALAPMTYRKLILGSAVLGRRLAGLSAPGERVGVMLPNACGALATFFALHAFGRVPAMLNVSAGADAMLAACAVAGVRTVLTSRAFVAKARLEAVAARMDGAVRLVWLEDLRAGIGRGAKLRGLFDALRARALPGASLPPASPAAVLFTSGSEGAPKGVVLSHRNILANIAQVASVLDFSPADRVLNALPMFHSFGLTGATLLPVLNGVRVFLYPSPLHYRVVPEMAYGTDATVIFGTDTFLSGWARYAHPYDFYAARYIVAGAERVREETRRLYADRFGVRILEGYGATETAPVLSLNTLMHNRPGTVGRLLPGIEAHLEPVPGIEGAGRLRVRGPNVMLGYLRAEAPGTIEVPPGGWYDTGDIVGLDAERYVAIRGRAKRFAKIAGEMVSMTAAEALAAQLWPDAVHAVVALPDARKGERLVLLTTRPGADAPALLAHARARGVAELLVPREVRAVGAVPLLGTGKVDYPAAQRLAAGGAGDAEPPPEAVGREAA